MLFYLSFYEWVWGGVQMMNDMMVKMGEVQMDEVFPGIIKWWRLWEIIEWGGFMVSSTCLEDKLIVYIEDTNIHCYMCECSIKKSGWGGHVTTRKHGLARGDIVVDVEKKQCCKRRGRKVLEMFSGENVTSKMGAW